MRWQLKTLLCVALTSLLGLEPAATETAIKKPVAATGETAIKKSAPAKAAKPPAAAVPQVSVPDGRRLRLLIYTTLIAVNQANLTGNYSVVRDLAAPSFREVNSSARLAEIFSALRRRNLDLSPILLLEPKLVRPPALMDNALLRLSGFFPSAPEQVNFDLAFQLVGGHWLLFGIAVNTSPAATAAAPTSPAAPKPAAEQATASNAEPAAKSSAAPAGKTRLRTQGPD